MYPTLLRIGSFEITTFGLMMFLAFVAAGWVLARQFRRYIDDNPASPLFTDLRGDDLASTMVMYAAIGGIVGAKIYYAILFHDWHLLFDRAGLVWYGGLIGGALACSFIIYRKGLPFLIAADAAAPALAIGYCLGRIGCFLVGDDYGRPTTSWVGIAFPKGSPPTTAQALRDFGVNVDPSLPADQILRVHPTQLYESSTAFVMFLILMYVSRNPHKRGRTFGLFLIMMGIERFLVEIVRAKDDRFLGPFTVAQLISVILVIIGSYLVARRERGREAVLAN